MSRSTTKKWDPNLPLNERVITRQPPKHKRKAGAFTKALSMLHADAARKRREEEQKKRGTLERPPVLTMNDETHRVLTDAVRRNLEESPVEVIVGDPLAPPESTP